jgi:hypothetical protein
LQKAQAWYHQGAEGRWTSVPNLARGRVFPGDTIFCCDFKTSNYININNCDKSEPATLLSTN